MTTIHAHPMQPLHTVDGIIRFRENVIVRYLLDHGGINLNDLAVKGFADDEWEQFAQLIGYSLDGYGELSYVRDETYKTAQAMSERGVSEQEARIDFLQKQIEAVRSNLRVLVPVLFRIHPDDLKE